MDKHYENIKVLIENNLVETKKNEIKNNYHTLTTYFNVGKNIVDAQGGETRAKYGDNLIKEYSHKLTEEYGKQYSERTLRNMRQFFLTFKSKQIWLTVSAKLNWSHFESLLPIKNESKRNYYINSTIEHNFSVRQLREYIKTNAYERLIGNDDIKLKHNIPSSNDNADIMKMIKKPILIVINKSTNKINENALKQLMIEQIEKTMLELGAGFAFVGSEIPIRIDNKILKPDLVFFNYEFNCFVILELKLKELTIKDIGQIEFYIKYYDSDIKKPFHNPTIGITISERVNKSLIDYNQKDNIEHTTYELIE